MLAEQAARLTDPQARTLVTKALRAARAQFRQADTQGEVLERDLDRLIKRKTRMNATQLVVVSQKYKKYLDLVVSMQRGLEDAYAIASTFGS